MAHNEIALDLHVAVNEGQGPGTSGTITAAGEIDVFTSPRLREAIAGLIEGGHYDIVVDLSAVRYIDSTGLGVLAGALRKVRERGGTISLICGTPQIRKIFQITGLDRVFSIREQDRSAASEGS